MRYRTDGSRAVEPVDLAVGQRIKLGSDRWWWTVRARTENFVAVTRQAEFREAGVLRYSVLQWRTGVRGPCDLVFGWYGDLDEGGCGELLAGFEDGRWEISQRNWVRIEITKTEELG